MHRLGFPALEAAPLKLASGWHRDGPLLPLEFVRQSDDDPELALALHEGAKPVPTYWAWLAAGSLDAARAMLGAREQIRPAYPACVGSIPPVDGAGADPRIAGWMRGKRIDAVVWTALPAKFDGASGRAPTAAEALAWLGSLRGARQGRGLHPPHARPHRHALPPPHRSPPGLAAVARSLHNAEKLSAVRPTLPDSPRASASVLHSRLR